MTESSNEVLLDGNGNVLLRNGSALMLGSGSNGDDWGASLRGDIEVDNTFICAPYKCQHNHSITSFSAPNVTSATLVYCFYGCTALTSVSGFSNLTNILTSEFQYCFINCTTLTTVPTFANVESIGKNGCQSCFQNCTALTTAPTFASLTTVYSQGLSSCFNDCPNLTTAPTFASLTTLPDGQEFYSCFQKCSRLTTAPTFASLTRASSSSFKSCFAYCSGLTTAPTFASLTRIGSSCFEECFYGCTLLPSISFPALTTTSFQVSNVFNNMFNSSTASRSGTCTIHFPSNLESTIQGLTGYPLFGGTSGRIVLAFDLPATS